MAIKPGIDTEIIRDLALAIAQISDSRNRGADCFPGTAKHPLGAPSQHPKAAAIRATKHVLTCPGRSQYSAWDILDILPSGKARGLPKIRKLHMAHEQSSVLHVPGLH